MKRPKRLLHDDPDLLIRRLQSSALTNDRDCAKFLARVGPILCTVDGDPKRRLGLIDTLLLKENDKTNSVGSCICIAECCNVK
jgi:hypothetical protein